MTLDPAIADMEKRMKEAGLGDLYGDGSGPEARARGVRAREQFYPKPDIPVGSVEDISIPGRGVQIPARIVRPIEMASSAPTIVYFHGGGWVIGDLDSHHAHVARIADRVGAVVLNVDYRLAPEHPFPAAAEDAFAALEWASDNISDLGGDPARLAVAGDSAGGNLAASAALHARDNGIELKAQLLIYPATDLTKQGGTPLKCYLGDDGDRDARDPRASPALASSLSGVAPAIIGVGPYDFLHEDNLAYAKILRRDGVEVLLRDFPTLNHGFFSFTRVSQDAEAAANRLCDDLKAFLGATAS